MEDAIFVYIGVGQMNAWLTVCLKQLMFESRIFSGFNWNSLYLASFESSPNPIQFEIYTYICSFLKYMRRKVQSANVFLDLLPVTSYQYQKLNSLLFTKLNGYRRQSEWRVLVKFLSHSS
jgi:hypothetical protein